MQIIHKEKDDKDIKQEGEDLMGRVKDLQSSLGGAFAGKGEEFKKEKEEAERAKA